MRGSDRRFLVSKSKHNTEGTLDISACEYLSFHVAIFGIEYVLGFAQPTHNSINISVNSEEDVFILAAHILPKLAHPLKLIMHCIESVLAARMRAAKLDGLCVLNMKSRRDNAVTGSHYAIIKMDVMPHPFDD